MNGSRLSENPWKAELLRTTAALAKGSSCKSPRPPVGGLSAGEEENAPTSLLGKVALGALVVLTLTAPAYLVVYFLLRLIGIELWLPWD